MLALLVSFVTSIATGIVTATLMDQAPPGVTQTINRVVEKTIERVVQEPTKQAAAVVTRETVVVKSDDAVLSAIEKNTGSVVRIREAKGEGRSNFAGLGLVVSREGLIVADISVAYRKTDTAGNTIAESYQAVFPDGRIFPLNIVFSDQVAGLLFLAPIVQDKEKGVYRFTPPQFSVGELKLGQAVVAISGDDTNSVSTGIISNLVQKAVSRVADAPTTTPQTVKEVVAIKTDIRSPDLVLGSLLLNLSGEVIGMNAGPQSVNRNTFLPIQKVLEELAKATAPAPTTDTGN
ncbi:MAG: hypothetical protein UY50_C0033G0013 [Parcubacteria group bacterium GW2011_GWA2_49_9]|nr:MAG: hypothetical protein UY50_C0033G0013 [Parcubacteria group bacterium GW2011_GWA2_49_9]